MVKAKHPIQSFIKRWIQVPPGLEHLHDASERVERSHPDWTSCILFLTLISTKIKKTR